MFATATIPQFIQPLRRERVLLWCMLVSIALHALVLLGISWGNKPAPPDHALLVLTARLAPAAAPRGEPRAHSVSPSRAPAAPTRPMPTRHADARSEPKAAFPALEHAPAPKTAPAPKPAREPKPALVAEPAPTPEPASVAKPKAKPASVPAPAVAASAARSMQPDVPVRTGPAPKAPAARSTAAVAESGSAADRRTLAQYRLALMAAAGRYKRYPASAVEKDWQGKVEVRMVIGANGRLADTSIETSSGHEILDHEAVDMLRKGKTLVQIPASLRGREFSLVVPVIFKLSDPGP